ALAQARIAALPRAGAAQLGGAPAIVPRAAWGGNTVKPKYPPSYGQVLVAVVHHTEQPGNTYTREEAPTYVLGIAKYHRDHNGWNDIGYNFLVDRFGTIYEGRAGGIDQPVIGAHALGFNSYSTGISILGNFMNEGAPAPALDAVSRLIAWKLPLHGNPVVGQVLVPHGSDGVMLERICGHRDVNQTDCPGHRLYPQLPEIRARAARLAGPPQLGPSLTLAAASRTVGYGEPVRFDGAVLAPDSKPQANVAVRIEKQGPSGAWATMAQTSSGADGRFTADVVWKRGALVRAVAEQVISRPVAVSVRPLIELDVDSASIRPGARAVLRGTMRPAGTLTVVVERRSGGRWRRERSVVRKVRRPAIALGITLRRAGTYRLRATARAGSGSVRVPSIPVRVVAR
ncbi:MAG: N-acetylmuramoyl-L-alanine amidase, partial [Solirubrobacteraceae bacterium]|nr:N-acetylmuramoyl-L-alanine amidase [Solirubrobacteraceae bacterium]